MNTSIEGDVAPWFPSDEELCRAGWIRQSRRLRQILSRPRVRQVYWVDFPHDAYSPEFVGEHPGVVIRAASSLTDPCIVVPLTSKDQRNRPHTFQLSKNPNPRANTPVWAVCDHLYTISIERLRPMLDRHKNASYPHCEEVDFQAIAERVAKALATILSAAAPAPVAAPMETEAGTEGEKPAMPELSASGRKILRLPGSGQGD